MSGNVRYKCPSCKAFLSLASFIEQLSDWTMCRSCGSRVHVPSTFDIHGWSCSGFALAAGSRRAETLTASSSEARGVASQSGPKGNAQSNLLPNGKIRKVKSKPDASGQLDLFGGAA